MTPNEVTFLRIVAGFAAVAVFSFLDQSMAADVVGIALTVIAIALDGVDGYIARARNLATPLGAQLDILGDRVIENLFFTFFAVTGLISLWVPIAFFARGATTDFLRGLASRSGRVGFGRDGMLDSAWSRLLVASRISRAAYATLKCVCFCYLGGLLAISHLGTASLVAVPLSTLVLIGKALTGCSVLFCFLRAIPVIWEGRRFVASPSQPATIAVARTPISGATR
ncbi:MAG TPA: CDP-alcohol phosphatidyltransferase family protein [Candidatus Acidoferrales bacterium]|nr:CDP-alcohol phosphatidyltransferase family protein [Candidatus Acidoferrales bacterium]